MKQPYTERDMVSDMISGILVLAFRIPHGVTDIGAAVLLCITPAAHIESIIAQYPERYRHMFNGRQNV